MAQAQLKGSQSADFGPDSGGRIKVMFTRESCKNKFFLDEINGHVLIRNNAVL